VSSDAATLRAFQRSLLDVGNPLHWYVDAPPGNPAFIPVQVVAGLGVGLGADDDLLFRPDDLLDPGDWSRWRAVVGSSAPSTFSGTRAAAVWALYHAPASAETTAG
jgi:hypothetical protein